MKDNRPSRKESKAQDNIREYLQDIAMGSTTHFSSSTVGKWRRRYRDFEKSEKLAWNDFETFFDGVPTVNEVEAPKVVKDVDAIAANIIGIVRSGIARDEISAEEADKRLREYISHFVQPNLCDMTTIEKYDRSITVPTEIADVIHYWEKIDNQIARWIIVGFGVMSVILGRAGHYSYSVM